MQASPGEAAMGPGPSSGRLWPRRKLRLCANGRHGLFRLGLRLNFGDKPLPVAAFFQAGVYCADLAAFLDDERCSALRARLGDGHVRRSEIAIRITRAAVEHARPATAAFARAPAAHEFSFVAFRAFDAHGDWARVLALRVSRAADEFAEAAVFFHQPVTAECAFLIKRLIRLMRDARTLNQAPRGLAVRVSGTGQEGAEAPPLDGHLLAAIVAILGLGFATGLLGSLRRKVLNKIAFGIARATEEKSMSADALQQFALAALFAFLPGRYAGFVRKHLVAGLVQVDDEFFPELLDSFAPRELAFFNLIKFFLEPRRKRDVENVFETLDQQRAHALAKHRGRKSSLVLGDVFALHDSGNDRRVRRRPPDAVFFQLFNERRIVEPRRRLGEVLVRANLVQAQSLPFHNLRKRPPFALVILFIVFAVRERRRHLVDAQVAVEFLHRAG